MKVYPLFCFIINPIGRGFILMNFSFGKANIFPQGSLIQLIPCHNKISSILMIGIIAFITFIL